MGAIASALVALVGVPAAVLIGRAQTRAAVRAAELGAEAGRAQAQAATQVGVAQAEATYRAAVDASRDQARAEYRQWRHTLRREAWATFATAVNDATTAAGDLVKRAGPNEDHGRLNDAVTAAMDTVKFAHSVVDLEGPAHVAEAARRVRDGVTAVLLAAAKASTVARAEGVLRAVENGDGLDGTTADHALTARDALHDLRAAARAQAEGSSYPINAAGTRNAAVAEAQALALTTLARCGVTGHRAASLIDDARHGLAPDNRRESLREAEAALDRTLAEWIQEARQYLDGDAQN